MAIITRYLDSAATGAANGTSWADAYTTWAAWNTAEANNLVTNGNSHVLKVRGNIHTLTAELSLTGWTTGASNTLTIEADQADRHTGVYSSSKPGLKMTGSVYNGGTLRIATPCGHIILRGLQFWDAQSYTGGANPASIFMDYNASGNFLTVEACLFRKTATSTNGKGVRVDASLLTTRIKNCVGYDYSRTGEAFADVATGTGYVYNNTIQNCTTGIMGGSNTRVVNCVFQGNTADTSGTLHSSTNYNLTNAASFPTGANNVTSTTLTFVNTAGDDFHLAAGDTAARGAGIGPSSDAEVLTTDVDGNTRSGTTTDIGFDLYVAASGPSIIRPATIIKSQRATMSGS